ncbi:hypothetical protein K450DRAFT_296646 [Umbelopsis ramanniana AG]|uniref:Calcipressin n=1 Tax=Umbelopsis ramanniana AG TaxID=1314678 RepID=A0AAD5EHB8_UMBRA|nr:uncharacterized protein K450DRAFT_296646 [Umbelopsis ramanniana AG]KAI8583866.1 hypothetical protein K450DRAFT_296646 [Umbelopsis ramanniana AG]
MPASPSPESIATNTLTIPDIPKEFFECPQVFEDLRNFLQMYGPLHTFVAIKGFARIMAVYEETTSAIMAKSELDKTNVYWKKSTESADLEIVQFLAEDEQPPTTLSDDIRHFLLRLYFGQHTNINPDSSTVLLQVPELEKNWLISPPGSPPVGWQQIREDPPNRTVLPHDLSHALMSLNDELEDDFKLDADAEFEAESMNDSVAENASSSSTPQVYVICKDEGHDINGHELPHITVQDWDGGAQHHNLEQYRRIHRKVAPTAMPPRSNVDKAPSLEDRPPTPMHLMR